MNTSNNPVRKKLLYLGNKAGAFGGTTTTMESLSDLFTSEGFEVVTASSKRNKLFRLLDMVFTLLRHMSSSSLVLIDTYSTQNFYYAVTLANICRLFGIPYIPVLHGGNLPQRLAKSKRMSWKLFNGAKVNVAPSRYLMEEFKAAGYTNLVYIPNTLEIDVYNYKSRSNISPRLLWVRSFSEIYNPMLALKILEELLSNGMKAELCMVGPEKDGSLLKCRQYAEERSLPVIFTGKLDKLEWVKSSEEYDIFINTTNFDNMPVSVIEAMALGLVVVSTKVGGLPFLLENDTDALLVDAGNKEGFCRSIKALVEDQEMVKKLTENARRKVEKFDWEEVKHLWFQLLKG